MVLKMIDYEEREELKKEGWKKFSDSKNAVGQVSALMHFIIPAHYWRARQAIDARSDRCRCLKKIFPRNYSPGYEMDIDHYTEHWLYSMKDASFMTPELFKACSEWYTPKNSKYLPFGCTEYQID